MTEIVLALLAALLGVPVGRALESLGARLVLATRDSTPRVVAPQIWPPDTAEFLLTRRWSADSTVPAELATALALAGLIVRFGLSTELLQPLAFTLVFLLLAFVDLRSRVVPNLVLVPAALLAIGLAALGFGPSWRAALAGGAVGLLLFAVIYGIGILVARRMGLATEALGMGDVKLAGLIGLVVGWPQVLTALLGGIVLGGLVSGALVIARQIKLRSYVPYAPFMLLAAFLTLIFQ